MNGDNAPITRIFVIACAVFTVLAGTRGHSATLGVSYQDIFNKRQFGRLLSSVFSFSSTPELIFGLYLLYYFRVFERQIGSNKYSVFILFSLLATTLIETICLELLKGPTFNTLASGPYAVIFASFVPFYFDIPVSTRFRVFGFPFSDKSFIYLAGLQLILSSWRRSLLPGICGIVAGLFYHLNLFYVRKIKFPNAVASFFSRLSWPVAMGGSSSTAARRNIPRNAPRAVHPRVDSYPPSAPFASMVEPAEDSIATLVSMGFDRSSARQALVQARNDLNAATNLLLETQSHS
ncbi:Rhomboid-like protein 20 [Nymphaea thermarum]|nr:Rhomboid-like protein 20 [Nymphaea thermarum]